MKFVILLAVVSLWVAKCFATSLPWWNVRLAEEQGPNVCVVEEIPGTKHKIWTECKYWNPREICGVKPILRYDCCDGYKKVSNTLGCIGVKPLRNVLETARALGAQRFVRYIEDSGMAHEFTRDGSITLFAPSDEAMEELTMDQIRELDRYKGDRRNPYILYHTLDSRITSPHFKADMLVETKNQGKKIRINKFSSKVETVNCATILRKDQEAINGVVHIIDTVLDPSVASARNLVDIVMQDGRFTQMAKVLQDSGTASKLRQSNQPVTILAPSDEAFQKLPYNMLFRILNDQTARQELVNAHIIPHTLCLPAIIKQHKLRTESGHKLEADCDRRGVFIDGKRLTTHTSQFGLGENGALYVLDDVIIPDRAKTLMQILEDEHLQTFLQVARTAGLEDMLTNYREHTIFAPSEEAMFSLPYDKLQRLRVSPAESRSFVLHHIVPGRILTDKFTNNHRIMTADEQYPIHLQVHRKNMGVDGTLIEKSDRQCLNGVVHVISKPLIPATQSVSDVVRRNVTFSTFNEAVEKAMISDPQIDITKPKTVFIPTNQAFYRLGQTQLQRILGNPTFLRKVLRNHMSDNIITSEALIPGLQYSMDTKETEIEITKENNRVEVNGGTVLECDMMTDSGIAHVINKVLVPDELQRYL